MASGDMAASGSNVGPVYIYGHLLLLRQTEDKFIHLDFRAGF